MSIVVLDVDTTGCEPSLEEVRDYAEFLGIDLKKEKHLEWIARDGLCAPVPHPWKTCTENGKDHFYFNSETGESIWDHPCDEKYRSMVEEYRKNRISDRLLPSPAMESMLENMWCGGIKDDNRTFEEIQTIVEAKCNVHLLISLVPNQYPGFAEKLMDYADVTQKDIDDAWLAAAEDVLGRPAIGLPPYDDSFGCSAYERFQFHRRNLCSTTVPSMSAFDVDRLDFDDGFSGSSDPFSDAASTSEVAGDDDQFFQRWPRFSTSR